jgi:hypothetical protein
MNYKQINVGDIRRVIKLPCAYLLGKYLRWQKLRTPIQHFYSGVCELQFGLFLFNKISLFCLCKVSKCIPTCFSF